MKYILLYDKHLQLNRSMMTKKIYCTVCSRNVCIGDPNNALSLEESQNSAVWKQHVDGIRHQRLLSRVEPKKYEFYKCDKCIENIIFSNKEGYFDHLTKHTMEQELPEEFKTKPINTEEERINREQEEIQLEYAKYLSSKENCIETYDDDLLYDDY